MSKLGAREAKFRDTSLRVPATSYSAPMEVPERWRAITIEALRDAAVDDDDANEVPARLRQS